MELTMEEKNVIDEMARAIQLIEHRGFHDWYSCHQGARDRATAQATVCFNIMNNFEMSKLL